jgi:hypothetical protein
VAAHNVERPAAPVTTFLLGSVVAGGMDVNEAAAKIQQIGGDLGGFRRASPGRRPQAAVRGPLALAALSLCGVELKHSRDVGGSAHTHHSGATLAMRHQGIPCPAADLTFYPRDGTRPDTTPRRTEGGSVANSSERDDADIQAIRRT